MQAPATTVAAGQPEVRQPTEPSASDTIEVKEKEYVHLKCRCEVARFAQEEVYVKVLKDELKYKLDPIHRGKDVILLNARDLSFYDRVLTHPKLTVWILLREDGPLTYVKKRLWEAAWKKNIQILFKVTNHFELVATKEGLGKILYNEAPVDLPDCVIPRVGAKVDYFGLAVIRQIEKMGVVILNELQSINISRDKLHTLQHIAAHGMPIPKTILAKFPLDLKMIERELKYPIILKKAAGSQGKGIVKLDNHEQLEDLADMLDTTAPLVFQEFIEHSKGRDLRVFVIGGKVVGAMMRVASKGFKANVHQGGTVKPVHLTTAVEWLALETVKLIGLDIAGVDLLIDKDTYKVCEVNSSPGFDGLEEATGIDIAGKMLLFVQVRCGVWKIGGKMRRSLEIPVQDDHNQNEGGEGRNAAMSPPASSGNAPTTATAVPTPAPTGSTRSTSTA